MSGACAAAPPERPEGAVHYEGSSTVAIFLRAAEPVYGAIDFTLNTAPESSGGEQAIVAGRTALAGIAKRPRSETLDSGVNATLIGRDAIAVIVNHENPIEGLSRLELEAIFTGEYTNWSAVGGPDLPIEPFVMGTQSATRDVFRQAVMGERDFEGCEVADPDRAMIERVADRSGGIGQISFSFLTDIRSVRAIAVNGEHPATTNFNYPIARPLYLLWRPGAPVVEAFTSWATTAEGQGVVMQNFVGVNVSGSAHGTRRVETGTLIVRSETFSVYDGGIYYHPHRSYEILDRQGNLIRRVRNHRGTNDEKPTRVDLNPGTYLIRTIGSRGERLEYFVEIDSGERTELDIQDPRKQR